MAGYFASLGSALGMNSDQTQGSLGATFGAVGLGLDIMGILGQQKAAQSEYKISQEETQTEMQMNDVRRQMMTIDANRKMIQSARTTQMAQARGKSAATNQGALFSSGEAGGQAQEVASGAFNQSGILQSLMVGNQMFDLTNQLDKEKMQMAQVQSQGASAQGMAAIGSAVLGTAASASKMLMLV